MSFHAGKCCHLVSKNKVSATRLFSSVPQFPLYTTFIHTYMYILPFVSVVLCHKGIYSPKSSGRSDARRNLSKSSSPSTTVCGAKSSMEVICRHHMTLPTALSRAVCCATAVLYLFLHDAARHFQRCKVGIPIRFRKDGSVFNLRRLQARTMTFAAVVRDLLYADDCALMAHTQADAQQLFNRLTSSLPVITAGETALPAVQKFCYLGSMLSSDANIDDNISSRLAKVSHSFGKLSKRL